MLRRLAAEAPDAPTRETAAMAPSAIAISATQTASDSLKRLEGRSNAVDHLPHGRNRRQPRLGDRRSACANPTLRNEHTYRQRAPHADAQTSATPRAERKSRFLAGPVFGNDP